MKGFGRPVPRPGRRAFTMVEIAISSLLLGIAMAVTVQVLGWVAAERRSLDRRQCALGEAANLLERLSARPWDRLSAEAARGMTLSEAARRTLPDAELSASVAEAGDAKRIAVGIRWRSRTGGWDAPVRLVAWSYRRRSER